MRIHTVAEGDTVFNIGRKYAIPPSKIIEHNGLTEPDRLIKGQKLAIFTPTRTYTVRGGDSLENIAIRFETDIDSLLAANPSLSGQNRCYPGQILSIKFDAPEFGTGISNGIYYEGCSKDRFLGAIPYLSYLTVSAARWEGGALRRKFKTSELTSFANEKGKIPLLRIFAPEDEKIFFEHSEELINNLPDYLLKESFGGVCLAAFSAARNQKKYAEFLLELKRQLMDYDLLLFVELDGNSDSLPTPELSSVPDGISLNYEKCHLEEIPSFKEAEAAFMTDYAENLAPEKTLIDLPSFAYSENCEIPRRDAEILARKKGEHILYDKDAMVSYFSYNKYSFGKKTRTKVVFPSLENICERMKLTGKLGYMGISFDIMRVPTEFLMMFHTMFRGNGMNLNVPKTSCRGE